MGAGPNFVLDKGYLATGADAYTAGEVVARTLLFSLLNVLLLLVLLITLVCAWKV